MKRLPLGPEEQKLIAVLKPNTKNLALFVVTLILLTGIMVCIACPAETKKSPVIKWPVPFATYWQHHYELTEKLAVAMCQGGKFPSEQISYRSYDLATELMHAEGIEINATDAKPMPEPEKQTQWVRRPTQYPGQFIYAVPQQSAWQSVPSR